MMFHFNLDFVDAILQIASQKTHIGEGASFKLRVTFQKMQSHKEPFIFKAWRSPAETRSHSFAKVASFSHLCMEESLFSNGIVQHKVCHILGENYSSNRAKLVPSPFRKKGIVTQT